MNVWKARGGGATVLGYRTDNSLRKYLTCCTRHRLISVLAENLYRTEDLGTVHENIRMRMKSDQNKSQGETRKRRNIKQMCHIACLSGWLARTATSNHVA
jgi:hypothetical protein